MSVRRVLVFARATTFHPGAGGMEAVTRSLMEAWAARGVDVTCVTTSRADGALAGELGGVRYHFLTGCPPGVLSREWFDATVAWMDGPRLAADGGPPQVVVSQSGSARAYVQHRRPRLGIPCVAHMHGLTPWNLRMAIRALEFPRGLVTLVKLLLRCAYERWIEPRDARRYDRLVALGPRMAEDLARHLGFDRAAIEVVPNFIDLDHFRPPREAAEKAEARARLALPPEARVVLMISRLIRTKGIACGLEALARAPGAGDVHALIAGEGPEEGSLRERARALGLEARVRFVGRVDRADLPRLHAAGDLLLFPSWFPEGLPMVVLEAMASGLPVIGTPAGETATAIEEGETGHLVPFRDADALARRMGELLGDPARLAAMGRRARARAETCFGRERVVSRHLEILDALAEGSP